MKKTFATLGLLSALGAVGFVGQPALANVTTHAAAFHNYNASENASIDYLVSAVRNYATSSRFVIASVAFVKAAGPSADVTFTIDGKNATGTSTGFSLYAHNAGLLRSGINFTTGPGAGQTGAYSTDQVLNGLDNFSRVSLLALLPPNSSTVLHGITQRQ